MARFCTALVIAASLAILGSSMAAAQDAAANSGPMTVTSTLNGDINAGGHFTKEIILPASGDVVVTVKQTSGTCLSGRSPVVKKGRPSTGGTMYAEVYQGPEHYGPSDESGTCMHALTFAPKASGSATVQVSNYSSQSVGIEMTITGASEPVETEVVENGEVLPKVPDTGRGSAE